MTLEQIKEIFENYENFKELAGTKFKQYAAEKTLKFPFYKATAHSYSFHDIDFDKGVITFMMDDFYNGYDLHDYDYQVMPIDYMFTDK